MASRKLFGSLLALAALAIALNSAYAKDISKTETAYEGAPSGIDPTTAKNLITSEGPPMTVEEFNRSKTIFFERCAGCHGVLRKGATGNIDAAAAVGKLVAERAKAAGIEKVAFDRAGYKYHGRVKALADAARESGLEF